MGVLFSLRYVPAKVWAVIEGGHSARSLSAGKQETKTSDGAQDEQHRDRGMSLRLRSLNTVRSSTAGQDKRGTVAMSAGLRQRTHAARVQKTTKKNIVTADRQCRIQSQWGQRRHLLTPCPLLRQDFSNLLLNTHTKIPRTTKQHMTWKSKKKRTSPTTRS